MILVVLAALFTTCLLVANIIAVKLFAIGDWVVPAGVIAYPLTFLFTDVIAELYGRKTASRVVWVGFGVSIIMALLVYLGGLLPPASFWEDQPAYEAILGMVPRVTLASIIAYLVSQHHDVFAFHFWRRKTKGRFLWLRNNASTLVSQAIDSAIFCFIAFWGVFDTAIFREILLSTYLLKLLVAVIDTPFIYLAKRISPTVLEREARPLSD